MTRPGAASPAGGTGVTCSLQDPTARELLRRFLDQARQPGRMVASADALQQRLAMPGGRRIVTVNLFELHHYVQDPDHRALIDSAESWTADGWPVVRALATTGVTVDRVTGSGLCADLLTLPPDAGLRRIAVLGSEAHVVDAFARRLAERGRDVVYRHTGSRAQWTQDDVRGPLRASDPELVLVAVGTPYGVEVAAHLEAVLPRASVIAVGAGVGLAVGLERRASPRVQRLHLEWAWRMATDPRRLTRRYLVHCAPLLPALRGAASTLAPARGGSET